MTDLLRPATRSVLTAPGTFDIGLVCPYSLSVPGGVQNHVLGLAGYLASVGDRVRILAPGELDPSRARQHGLSPEQITSVGPGLPVPYNGSVARVALGPVVAARVRRWMAAQQLDLLHIHEPLAPGVSVLTLGRAEVPVVATFHTATPRSRLMRLAGALLRSSVGRIEAGIAVSEPARQVVVEHLDRHPPVIPNGISAADFDPVGDRSPTGPWRAGDRPRLTFLGRLDEPRKGLDVLVAALPMIMRRHPELEVVIAGRGRLSRIRRRLPAGCVGIGAVDDAARSRLLRTTDLFVAPHVARESFGIVLIEAIAAGASVIASDLPAFTDLLIDGEQPLGFLFPAGDPEALATTVDRALAADREGLNARARTAVQRYDWSRVGPAVRSVYAGLLDR